MLTWSMKLLIVEPCKVGVAQSTFTQSASTAQDTPGGFGVTLLIVTFGGPPHNGKGVISPLNCRGLFWAEMTSPSSKTIKAAKKNRTLDVITFCLLLNFRKCLFHFHLGSTRKVR